MNMIKDCFILIYGKWKTLHNIYFTYFFFNAEEKSNYLHLFKGEV